MSMDKEKKGLSRRNFVTKTITGAAVLPQISKLDISDQVLPDAYRSVKDPFSIELGNVLPDEDLYAYHERLSNEPVHISRRDPQAVKSSDEMAIPESGWSIYYVKSGSAVLDNAVLDFQDYLKTSQEITADLQGKSDLRSWKKMDRCIVAGTRAELPGCGEKLKGEKDYEIIVSEDRIVVCGYDDRGVMFGLCNLEERMNLREGPFLPKALSTVRHSLYKSRMALSWMGWMEWPDQLFAHMVHDGFDSIFASVYANPNGDRTTAENSTDFYARILHRVRNQDPKVIRSLIDRAAKFGIKVYTPIIYQYMGTPESEAGLRKLVREIVAEFPDIRGYVLLTEGFWYKSWGGGHGADRAYMEEWAINWSAAVRIVEEECHRVDPSIEIIPWEYNIDFRPQNAEIKKFFIQQLPENSIPMLTWENGKSYELDGMQCYLRDYSLNQVGPAEVTDAQIGEANKRGMKVYSKVDTFASWQYGTIPYLPCPDQWYERYEALEKFGVQGTLESWSSGYKPNFISEFRAWTCWTDAPGKDELLQGIASKIFGAAQTKDVLEAWDLFSQAIRLVPDTGPNFGTNNAIGNPLFFQQPVARTATYKYSWADEKKRLPLNPYWPFTVSRMVFYPDFSNKTNKAEKYARSATGLQVGDEIKVLPIFLKYLYQAAEKMEAGLKLYRMAAQNCSPSKKEGAFREVVVAEQLHRMMLSDHAVLEFEDIRIQLMAESDKRQALKLVGKLEDIARLELERTELSLQAAEKDSRLGFQFEQDYVYTPYALSEKIGSLRETLEKHLPDYREKL